MSDDRASIMSHQTAPPPMQPCLPPFVWQHNLPHLEENFSMVKLPHPMLKCIGKTQMVEEPSHVKDISKQ